MNKELLKKLEGKTIKSITFPERWETEDQFFDDDNIKIETTHGDVILLSSWDSEGYNSGITTTLISINIPL